MEKRLIEDKTLIGEWEDVKDIPLSTITKRGEDTAKLDGIVIKSYEMKFGTINENREEYDANAFDDFVNEYFVKHNLNMIVDIQHRDDIDSLAGKVIYLEVNTTGLYFVVYIPRTYVRYEQVKNLLAEGILQGFSKLGWATDYEYLYNKDGSFNHCKINRMDLCSVSLVSMPANAIAFEKVAEIKNRLMFENKLPKQNEVEKLFNKK